MRVILIAIHTATENPKKLFQNVGPVIIKRFIHQGLSLPECMDYEQ